MPKQGATARRRLRDQPQRALLFPFTEGTWGHTVRLVALGEQLQRHGYDVTLACPDSLKQIARRHGMDTVSFVGMREQRFLSARSRAELRSAARTLSKELTKFRKVITTVGPAVVVSDLQPIANVAAALECLPSAAVLNAELLRQPFEWWLPGIQRALAPAQIPKWTKDRIFGDLLLLADSPEVIGLRDLPTEVANALFKSVREVRYVGAIQRTLPRWRFVPRRRPRVLVSFGLAGSRKWLAPTLAGLGGLSIDLVAVTGGTSSSSIVRAASEFTRVGPGSCRLVSSLADFSMHVAQAGLLITHGGHGTLVEALTIGVPTLVIPSSEERELNAERVLGLGKVAPPDRDQLRHVLADMAMALMKDREGDHRRRVCADKLRAGRGAALAAESIVELVNSKPRGQPLG